MIKLSDKDNYSYARHVAYARQLDSAPPRITNSPLHWEQ